jgi:DHA2 family multidrug resistance protein-like MFS transporter
MSWRLARVPKDEFERQGESDPVGDLPQRRSGASVLVTSAGAPTAGRREWVGLAVIALPCLLYSMDLTVLYLALPRLTADLKPSSAQLLWITDIYGFMLAGFLIPMGTLGDRIGRRRLLLIGAAAFGVASMLAAFASTVAMLIAARALLGIAAATLAPSTLSLIRNMFLDPRERMFAIGVWVTSFSVGGALGPLLGGLVLHFFWWGSVFLIAVPVMALLLVLGPVLLPEYRDPEPGRLDLASAALSLVSVLALVYGAKALAVNGFGPEPALSFGAGLALGLVFVLRQRKLAEPLLDLRLFRTPAFSTSLAANTLSLFLVFGSFFLLAQYLQLVLGLSPLVAGLWTAPSQLGFVVGSLLAPRTVRRLGPGITMAYGLAIAAIGSALLTQLPKDGGHGLAILVTGSVLLALGVSPVITLATDLIVGAAPPERAGVASALSETGTELGGALGIALLGSIVTAVYRLQLGDALPAGLSSRDADTARSTLAAAAQLAARLPDHLHTPLLAVAGDAYTHGLHVAAIVSAALAITLAVLAATILRHAQPAADRDSGTLPSDSDQLRMPTPAETEPCSNG